MIPTDAQLHLATHATLSCFFGTSLEEVCIIKHPTTSLLKWLAVPHLDANDIRRKLKTSNHFVRAPI